MLDPEPARLHVSEFEIESCNKQEVIYRGVLILEAVVKLEIRLGSAIRSGKRRLAPQNQILRGWPLGRAAT
jgi:hypothetical protein